jgi:hypothetical protein
MGIGPYALAFNQSFLRSQDNSRRQGQADLQEAMTMEDLRQRGELGADLGGLTGAFQARRAALANQPPPAPGAPPAGMPPPPVSPDAMMGGTVPGVTPPTAPPAPGLVASGPGPAGAPADEGPRRKSLLESIDPAMAGRLLRTGAGRSALKDLETAEKEQEQADNRKLAETVFTDATKAMRDGDALGYYDNAAKAMRIMGHHESAAKYLEHAMNLRGDQDEQKKANEDLGRWLKAQAAYTNDPSPDNYNKFMEDLGQANSKASRAMRVQIANNVLTKTFDQNPKVASFSRGLAGAYRDAWATGKDPDVEKIFKDLAGKDPEGFQAYIYDAMVGQKKLPDVVVRKILKWDSPDKEIPKNISEKAWLRTRQRFPSLRADDPKFLEAWWADEIKMSREMAVEKKPDDTRKEFRADRSELRQRLNGVRAELRRVDPEDSARLMELRQEEAQAKADLDEAEAAYRKQSGVPEGKPAEVKIPINAPNPKLKTTDEKYRNAARAEMTRLGQAGYTRNRALAEMRKAGWQ